jgi:hypothetical protein
VTSSAVRPYVDKATYVHGDLSAKITLDPVLSVHDLSNGIQLGFLEVADFRQRLPVYPRFYSDLSGYLGPYPVYPSKGDIQPFPIGDINSCYARHVLLLI